MSFDKIGETVLQTVSASSGTGAKYFGTGLAASSVNPNAKEQNSSNLKLIALIVVGALAGYFIYKKVK